MEVIMNKDEYQKLVKKYEPKENKLQNVIYAFLIGGMVGFIAEGLIVLLMNFFDLSRLVAGAWTCLIIIFAASLFTALGFFDKMVNFARCGLIIPITGFAHSMTSAGLEYKKEGLIYGIGSNIFKLAGSVILYGVVSAWFFGMIRYFLFGGV